jgi:photosystem II stability/assembly factor-like uncharacterized protein
MVADGELKACQVVTVDQAWAVGERGLILATQDAGKSWSIQMPRNEATLNAVCFANSNLGWALGGTILSGSQRSIGVVYKTTDGGRNWQKIPCKLSRVTGTQLVEKDHLLAWGDWSNFYQSALFESIDGGNTWAARPTPCGHIQSAACGPDGSMILIDRAGKVHMTRDGFEYLPVELPISPFEPMRFCRFIEGQWWLGGDAGQLYKSDDAVQWQRMALPGNADDHALISLKDIAGHRHRVCVVGQPGNVVWITEDAGESWTVRKTGVAILKNSISVLNSDVLMTCGPLTSIHSSRNGGKAWWSQHQSGVRVAVLNIASTCSSIAWDLLTQVTLESRRNASLLVVHDQSFEERFGHRPELASRLETASKDIQLSQTTMLANFPVGNLYSGVRLNDLGYYGRDSKSIAEQEDSPILRRLVHEIRSMRPDLLVINCSETGSELEIKTSQIVSFAARIAANKEFRLFSEASGVPDDVWQTTRIVARGTKTGHSYSPAMFLKKSNLFLGCVISNPINMVDRPDFPLQAEQRFAYRIINSKGNAIRDPLEGASFDTSTQMNDRSKPPTRLPIIMSVSQLLDWKHAIHSEGGNPVTHDRVWESKLRELAKDVSPETLSPLLLDIAVQSRRAGDWQRWQAALELAIEKDGSSSKCENVFWELMTHTGSREVHQVIDSQLKIYEQRTGKDRSATNAPTRQASPFATAQPESSPVKQVAFANSVYRVPASTNKDLAEFSKSLSRWHDSLYSLRAEPRWGWLIASRYRAMQQRDDAPNGLDLSRSPSVFWPMRSPQILAWSRVHDAEHHLIQQSLAESFNKTPPMLNNNPIQPLTWTDHRPLLDGKDDENIWKNATKIELRDPWNQRRHSTTIRMARDREFLYLFSRSPKYAPTQSEPTSQSLNAQPNSKAKDTRRDRLHVANDHIRIRLDLDRDYASWFEMGWSIAGDTWDAYNDMPLWNPTWYIFTAQDESSWSAEIAIPLEQIEGNSDYSPRGSNEVWALNAVRSIPGISTLSIEPSIADRICAEDWIHLDLSAGAR